MGNSSSGVPRPFSASKCGTSIKLSEECSVAEKVRPEDYHNCGNGVVYTAQPLPVGEVWTITVLSTTRGWTGGLVSGCTILRVSPEGGSYVRVDLDCTLYTMVHSQWPVAVGGL